MKTPDDTRKTPNDVKKALKCESINGEFCKSQISCLDCMFYVSEYISEQIAADALEYINELESDLEQEQHVTAGLEIMLTSAQSTAETWKRMAKAIQRDFGEFAARINAGEDLMACEYCKKNYAEGECRCNCLKDFEWRGIKEDE